MLLPGEGCRVSGELVVLVAQSSPGSTPDLPRRSGESEANGLLYWEGTV